MIVRNGRPPKYTSDEQLEEKINSYFDWCDSQAKEILTEKGVKIVYKPYTVSGLCLYLGICRDTLCEYEKNGRFTDTIKRAKNRIENYVEEHSLMGDLNPTVSIFNLKNNFGWKDKQEIESNNKNDNTVTIKLEGDLEKWAK